MAETVLAKLAVEISAKATQFGKTLSDQEKSLKKFQGTVTGVSNSLKGALATLGVAAIGREIIEVTSQFQKFSAVLTNTLGSSSEAQKALAQIQSFAAKTPFSVQELTSSFVKLANQGFVPTTEQLRKLGDLASSTGKSFDQLAEAIIDAQAGEFERLKEFGIRAQKQGDQVKFTFKGVQTQVAFTSEEINKYILSLGDLQGVSGSMAAISQTLGGRISNLGDSFDQLLLALGALTGGPLNAAIEGLTKLVNVLTDFTGGDSDMAGTLNTMIDAINTGELEGDQLAELMKITQEQADKLGISLIKLTDDVTGVTKVLIDPRSKIKVIDPEDGETQVKTLQSLQAEIAKLNTQFATTDLNDKQELTNTGLKILAIQSQIEALEALRKKQTEVKDPKLSTFGQQQLKNAQAGLTTPTEDLASSTIGGGFLTLPPVKPPDMEAVQEAFSLIQSEYVKTGEFAKFHADISAAAWEQQQAQQDAAAASAQRFGAAVGEALGNATQSEKSFSQTLKTLTKQILSLFLQQALGAAISGSFKTAKNPIVGAVLAGIASGVVSAMFSRIGGPSKSVGGGSISSGERVGRVERLEPSQQIQVTGEFVLHGNDAVAQATSEQNRLRRLGR